MTRESLHEEHGTEWIDETIPKSRRFADTYYSKADGLAETRHVFLGANRLEERFAACADTFTIGELGFGTGLNFLAAAQLWDEKAPPEAQLNFISFELYPLTKPQMAKALSRWPELEDAGAKMLENWQPDFEFFQYERGNISATVFFSDANIRLPQLAFAAEAWFLDGFAPSRNPQLWNETLMAEVFRHTNPGGTFATYAAAGFARRNLQAAGFVVEKRAGFSGKREMMAGIRNGG